MESARTQFSNGDEVSPQLSDAWTAQREPYPLGAALRAAREARNMSMADIVAQTRIAEPYLRAIKEGRFELFSANIYAVGFTRSYARAVGVEEEWAVEQLRAWLKDHQPRWRKSGWL